MSSIGLEFLQIQDTVHELFLGVLDPVERCQVLPIEVGAVFLFAEGRSRLEHLNYGEYDGVWRRHYTVK